MYEQLYFTESAHEDLMITAELYKELILSTSCLVRNANCLSVSKTLFQNWITDFNKGMKTLILSIV